MRKRDADSGTDHVASHAARLGCTRSRCRHYQSNSRSESDAPHCDRRHVDSRESRCGEDRRTRPDGTTLDLVAPVGPVCGLPRRGVSALDRGGRTSGQERSEKMIELFSITADSDSAALARLCDRNSRSRLHRAGRGGVRTGRSAGGQDRRGRGPTGAVAVDNEGRKS
jgi:hypothetical protein